MKIALITAITNNFDDPKPVPEQTVPYTRLFFTDKDVPDEYRHLDSRTQALYFKQQMHRYAPEFDYWLWVDGKIQIDRTDFVQQCLDALGDGSLAILKHGERNCVYDELKYVIDKTRGGSPYFVSRFAHRIEDMEMNIAINRALGYPKKKGLHDCSVMLWKNENTNCDLQYSWWKQCQNGNFDQTEIMLLCWAMGIVIKPIEFKPGSFHLVKHNKVE